MPAEVSDDEGWKKLGLIAGSGMLPVRIAQAEQQAGREPFIVRLFDDEPLTAFQHKDHSIAEVGGVIRTLRAAGCDAVCFAGIVKRPNFAKLRPDWRGARLLPKVVAAALRGDGAIIDVVVSVFEEEGFRVVGADEAALGLQVDHGPLGRFHPASHDFDDIRKAAALIEAIGPFDVGQAAIIRRGFVLAVEAAEGTDEMLERCANLPENLKGFEPGEEERLRGVLVKVPKPGQELRVDLPTLGVSTVENAHAAGLAGIAVRGQQALVVDRRAVQQRADELGLFVYAFDDQELTAL